MKLDDTITENIKRRKRTPEQEQQEHTENMEHIRQEYNQAKYLRDNTKVLSIELIEAYDSVLEVYIRLYGFEALTFREAE